MDRTGAATGTTAHLDKGSDNKDRNGENGPRLPPLQENCAADITAYCESWRDKGINAVFVVEELIMWRAFCVLYLQGIFIYCTAYKAINQVFQVSAKSIWEQPSLGAVTKMHRHSVGTR
jgi:hypothetical protein